MNIQTDVDRLPPKIKFVTVNHGKPPFGVFCSKKNYNQKSEPCLSFFKHKICEIGNPALRTPPARCGSAFEGMTNSLPNLEWI